MSAHLRQRSARPPEHRVRAGTATGASCPASSDVAVRFSVRRHVSGRTAPAHTDETLLQLTYSASSAFPGVSGSSERPTSPRAAAENSSGSAAAPGGVLQLAEAAAGLVLAATVTPGFMARRRSSLTHCPNIQMVWCCRLHDRIIWCTCPLVRILWRRPPSPLGHLCALPLGLLGRLLCIRRSARVVCL
jgi:hypothetical protein